MPSHSVGPRFIVGIAFALGVLLRVLPLDVTTPDWDVFYQPWYDHARRYGLAGLKDEFTSYAPFYSYLLIAVAAFDGLSAPTTLIKCISFPFEFGCALVGARLASLVDPRPERAALAFSALWLSPSVLNNGAVFSQCDAVWTFFVLLAVWAACVGRTRWAVSAFAMALAVKLQAIFLGPFLFGLLIRRRENVAWFVLVPLVYLIVALPVLLAGRPFMQVALVYFGQAEYYPNLWKGAANLYNLIPEASYHPGLGIGLVLAGLGGLTLAWSVVRAKVLTEEGLLLASALSLALMPFLLPKMHERFFFAFDAMIVILASLRPIYVPVAIAALANSIICYLPFVGRGDFAQHVAGFQSLIIILYLAQLLIRSFAGQQVASADPERDKFDFLRPTAALWFSYLAYSALKAALGGWLVATPVRFWPDTPAEPIGLLGFLACLVVVTFLLRRAAPRVG